MLRSNGWASTCAHILYRTFFIPACFLQTSYSMRQINESFLITSSRRLLSLPRLTELLKHERRQVCFLAITVVVYHDIFHASSRCTLISLRQYQDIQNEGIRRTVGFVSKFVVHGDSIRPCHRKLEFGFDAAQDEAIATRRPQFLPLMCMGRIVVFRIVLRPIDPSRLSITYILDVIDMPLFSINQLLLCRNGRLSYPLIVPFILAIDR